MANSPTRPLVFSLPSLCSKQVIPYLNYCSAFLLLHWPLWDSQPISQCDPEAYKSGCVSALLRTRHDFPSCIKTQPSACPTWHVLSHFSSCPFPSHSAGANGPSCTGSFWCSRHPAWELCYMVLSLLRGLFPTMLPSVFWLNETFPGRPSVAILFNETAFFSVLTVYHLKDYTQLPFFTGN